MTKNPVSMKKSTILTTTSSSSSVNVFLRLTKKKKESKDALKTIDEQICHPSCFFSATIDVDLEVDEAVSVAPGSDDNKAPVDVTVAGDKGSSGSLGKSSAYINLAGLLHKSTTDVIKMSINEKKETSPLLDTLKVYDWHGQSLTQQ